MQEKIVRIMEDSLREKIPSSAVSVTVSPDHDCGHYATNAAFALAKQEKKSPKEAARELAAQIQRAAPEKFFEKVEATPQGFVNFWLSPAAFHEELGEMLAQGERYGASDSFKGRKIQLEFISANPTGPLTLANGRGGFLGDALANALARSGAAVEREYYVNDTGNQIITLGKSVLAAIGRIPAEEEFYKGEYVREWAALHGKEVEKLGSEPLKAGQMAAKELLGKIRRVIEEKANIRFDRWTSEERDVHEKGFIEKVRKLFEAKRLVYKDDGAVWLRTTQFGDDKDRVLLTSDGYPTYFLADAGHFVETKERGFGEKILILGPDHYGYVKRISAVAEVVGIKKFEAIVTQAARLVKDGKEVKMSKRKGEFITLEELIDEVGADAARFFFLQVAPESHMDFDMGLAKERSAKNPVYYAQYAFVRSRKIIEKARNMEYRTRNKETLARLTNENELRLIRALVQYKDKLAQAAAAHRVHHLAHYVVEAARAFHHFYEKERVLGAPKEVEEARVFLVRGVATVLGNVLDTLGISKPQKM